jgi:hypothetical protein
MLADIGLEGNDEPARLRLTASRLFDGGASRS